MGSFDLLVMTCVEGRIVSLTPALEPPLHVAGVERQDITDVGPGPLGLAELPDHVGRGLDPDALDVARFGRDGDGVGVAPIRVLGQVQAHLLEGDHELVLVG